MAGSRLRWTKSARASIRRRVGARPNDDAVESEIATGILKDMRGTAYRFADGPDGRVEFIGENVRTITGHPAAEFTSGRVALKSLLGARDAVVRAQDIALALRERRNFDLQYPIRTADGEDRWLREQGRGIYAGKELLAVEGLLTDFTESKRPLGEEMFGLMVQWISDYAIFTLDPSGLVATWNGGAQRILGYAAEEIVGRPFSVFYPEVGGDAEAALRRAAESGSDTSRGWLRRLGGTRFLAHVVLTPIFQEGRLLTGFALIARDLGVAAGNGEAETRLHQLADQVPAFVWVADADGKIGYVNARWTEYTGQSTEEALGDGWTSAVHPDDIPIAKQFWHGHGPSTDKRLLEAEYRIRSADGGYRWFLHRGAAISDAQGRVAAVFGSSADVDEKVEAWRRQKERADSLEQAVAERTKLLKESVDELESFSYTASHDLRAPLRSIAGRAQLLLRDFGEKLTEGGREHLQRLGAAAEKLDHLLHDLVVYTSLARVKHGMAEVVDLDRFIAEIISRLFPDAATSIRGPLGRVRCPRSLLTHAIGGVLDNARKFVKDGEKPVVRIWSEDKEPRLRLFVEDEGIGIDPGLLGKAFLPFQRVHGQEYAGTGIGLAIVKRAAEQMGGSVRLESELGRGSRACLELPRA